jgi:hypothetical protein
MFAYLKCKRLVAYTHSKYACGPPGLISLDESTHELGEQISYHSPNRQVVLLQTTRGINKLNAFTALYMQRFSHQIPPYHCN